MKTMIIVATMALTASLSACSQEASDQQVVQNAPIEEAVNTVPTFTPPAEIAPYAEGFVYEHEGVDIATLSEDAQNQIVQDIEDAMAVAQYQGQNPGSDEILSISKVYVNHVMALRRETIELLQVFSERKQRGETVTDEEINNSVAPVLQRLHKASMKYLYMMDRSSGHE